MAPLWRCGPLALTLCALLLWWRSLGAVDVRRMNDLGLVSVFPVGVYLALAAVVAAFCLSLARRRLDGRALLCHVLALIVMLYGVTALVEPEPRFPTVWDHVAIIDYILRHGGVDPGLSAYFNWPGFFILTAFLTRAAGVPTMLSMAAWAPVFFNVLYLGPLLMIMSAATSDRRLVWLGVWLFYLTNWIGQDYFSPQGLSYALHLTIIGILLLYFKAPRPFRRPARGRARRMLAWWLNPAAAPGRASAPGQRAALLCVIMTLYVVTVFSHQLTPFATLASVIALVVFNRCAARGLLVFMLVALVAWLSFMATDFLSGNLASLLRDVGAVHRAVGDNVSSRLEGSAGHVLIVRLRVLMALGVWALATLGALRRLRNGNWDLTYALLAIMPFSLAGLQTYGGEMLLRVYLFALPAMVFFIAALFYVSPRHGCSRRAVGASGALSILLLGGFLFTRYGNERMDYISPGEVRGVERLYAIARPGSVFTGLVAYLPVPYKDFEEYGLEFDLLATLQSHHAASALLDRGDLGGIARALRGYCPRPSYLIVTRSEEANMELFAGVSPRQMARVWRALRTGGPVRVAFDDGDALIATLPHGCAPARPSGKPRSLFGVPVAADTAAHRPAPHAAGRRAPSLFGVPVGR